MSGVEIFGQYYPPIVLRDIFRLCYLILGIISVFALGRLLHESTHWLVAWLVGAGDIQVKIGIITGGVVKYTLPPDAPRWKYWAIQSSPQCLGLLLVVPYLAWLILEGTSPLLWYVVGAFLVSYSVLGGASDLIPAAARGDGHLWHPSERDQLYLIALGMSTGGLILGSMDANGTLLEHWGAWTGRWLIAGGGAIVFWDMWRRHQADET